MAEIIWEDAGREPVNVRVYSCRDHIHLVARCPLTPELGYHVILDAREAAALASKIVSGLEDPRDADEYDTSNMYIA
jgi:hypothetical protein